MTQLFCVIPRCGFPSQHQADCETTDCLGCLPRLATEGWTCDECVGHMHQLLGVIADLAPDARAVAAGQVRRGPSAGGGGKPGSRPPLDAGATDALDEITASLAKIARAIAHTRGLRAPQSHAEGRSHADPLTRVCEWISGQLEWVRHATDDQGHPYAVTVHAAIRDAASRIRAIVNGPGARRYLGPCGAELIDDNPPDDVFADCPNPGRCLASWDCHAGKCEPAPAPTCDGDVYGRPGAANGTCRTCGATVAQDDRREWLDTTARNHAYRASEFHHAYGLNAATIRKWAERGLLTAHDHDQHGRPLYLLGDVLDLAATEATRRETARQKRIQRQAAQAAAMGA